MGRAAFAGKAEWKVGAPRRGGGPARSRSGAVPRARAPGMGSIVEAAQVAVDQPFAAQAAPDKGPVGAVEQADVASDVAQGTGHAMEPSERWARPEGSGPYVSPRDMTVYSDRSKAVSETRNIGE